MTHLNSVMVLAAYVIVALWLIKKIVRWGITPTFRRDRDRPQQRPTPAPTPVWDDADTKWLAMYHIDLTRVADERETS